MVKNQSEEEAARDSEYSADTSDEENSEPSEELEIKAELMDINHSLDKHKVKSEETNKKISV